RFEHHGQADSHHDYGNDGFADHRPQQHHLQQHAENEHEYQRKQKADEKRHAEFHHHGPAHPGADQQELALGEVDDLCRLVDKYETHGHHAVERADDDAVDQKCQ